MSTKATRTSNNSVHEILCINGQSALSDFRVAKLNENIQRIEPDIKITQSAFRYFIKLNKALQEEEHGRRAVRARGLPAEALSVHACLHDHAEEAELGPKKSSPGATHQWIRSHQLHSW